MYIADCFSFAQLRSCEVDLLLQVPSVDFFKTKKIANWYNLALFHNEIEKCDEFIIACHKQAHTGLSVLISLDSKEWKKRLERAHFYSAFVVHPYLQNITDDNINTLVDHLFLCKHLNLPIFICTAIGSEKMYKISPLKIASAIAESYTGPIILCHGGGLKVLEAMLIAQSYSNVYLDTSFSLPFWQGSSVEGDMAFAMKKTGEDRWLYGSDSPFVDEKKAINAHLQFFEKYDFSQKTINQIMGQNCTHVLRGYESR